MLVGCFLSIGWLRFITLLETVARRVICTVRIVALEFKIIVLCVVFQYVVVSSKKIFFYHSDTDHKSSTTPAMILDIR